MAFLQAATANATAVRSYHLLARSQAQESRPSPKPSSSSSSTSSRRRLEGVEMKKKPTAFEVQRAIGATDDHLMRERGGGRSSGSVMDLLASSPIGQAEGSAEKKLREFTESIVDRTEAGERSGQKILLTVCVNILPVWLLLLLVASGVLKLPFRVPFLEDLIM